MSRAMQVIQTDIAHTAREVQELRGAQGPVWDRDRLSIAQRIHELTVRLDSLYAEKRAAQSPVLATDHPAPERRRAKNNAGLLAQEVFGSKPAA